MFSKFIKWLTALPKASLFNNEGIHIWGAALFTYIFMSRSFDPMLVVAVAIAITLLHEFWYDGLLPGAPKIGNPIQPYPGRLENWLGYVAGITVGTVLWLVHWLAPVAVAAYVVVFVIAGIVLEFRKR